MPTDPTPDPLSPAEERTWRGLVRLLVQLPRALGDELARRDGLGMTRYIVLMRLSEAPEQTLRMSDLAGSATISPSRLTRIVQAMTSEGLIIRRPAPDDARAILVTLTDAGLARLQQAWPAHLAGVRGLVLDHLDPDDLADLDRITTRLLAALDASSLSCKTADDGAARLTS